MDTTPFYSILLSLISQIYDQKVFVLIFGFSQFYKISIILYGVIQYKYLSFTSVKIISEQMN
jgi:hypothetical protein